MKKIVLCACVIFLFQQCTDELGEIDSVLISPNGEELANHEFGQNDPEIPLNAFLGRYYREDQQRTVISGGIVNKLDVDNDVTWRSQYAGKAMGAEWVGDFEFEAGEYEFNVHADKGVKILIDDNIFIDDVDNRRQASYKAFITLEGVHRILVFYNMDKNQVGDILIEYYTSLRNARNLKVLNNSNKSVKDFTTSIRQGFENEVNGQQFGFDWGKVR